MLDRLHEELRFALITSDARVYAFSEKPSLAMATDDPGLAVVVKASAFDKCARCWHHREEVGANADHPQLCGRCVENVDGDGESRKFV